MRHEERNNSRRPAGRGLKYATALALLVGSIGALLALFWGIVAAFVVFAYGDFTAAAVVVGLVTLLVAAPVLGLRRAFEGRLRLTLLSSLPALSAAAVVGLMVISNR